jgi:hypothetical protein
MTEDRNASTIIIIFILIKTDPSFIIPETKQDVLTKKYTRSCVYRQTTAQYKKARDTFEVKKPKSTVSLYLSPYSNPGLTRENF